MIMYDVCVVNSECDILRLCGRRTNFETAKGNVYIVAVSRTCSYLNASVFILFPCIRYELKYQY